VGGPRGYTHQNFINITFLTEILHSLTTSSYSVILHSLNPAHIHSFKVASVTCVTIVILNVNPLLFSNKLLHFHMHFTERCTMSSNAWFNVSVLPKGLSVSQEGVQEWGSGESLSSRLCNSPNVHKMFLLCFMCPFISSRKKLQ